MMNMRKTYTINGRFLSALILGAAALVSGCGKEAAPAPETPDSPQDRVSLTCLIEGRSATKTTYDGLEGTFAWSDADPVAIHFAGRTYVSGTIDPANGEVSFTAPEGRFRDFYAVYPASAAVEDLTNTPPALLVSYPDAYDVTDILAGTRSREESPCPMVAVNDPYSGVLDFYHVGGLLRLTLRSVPAQTQKVRVTVDKDITGTYSVAAHGTTEPTVTTVGSSIGNAVTFTLTANAAGVGTLSEPVVLNLPVPCGTYASLAVELLDSSGAAVASEVCPVPLEIVRHHGRKIKLFNN